MKKLTILSVLMYLASAFACFGATSSYDLNKPVGWGTVKKQITGGEGGTCVTVTSASDLEKYLKASGKYTIYVKGAITVNSMISVQVKDKSIYGLPGSYLHNPNRTASGSGILYFKSGSDNIIMRNMTFKSAGAYDVDGNDNFCIDGTTNIWVDHCDFQDGVDGNFDCKNSSDYVCVTWCRFHYLIAPKAGGSGGSNDHRYTNLWGSSDSKTTDAGHLNTTFMFCWWGEGCVERMPRIRFGKVHILNCLYNSKNSNYCIGAGNSSSIYVEKSAFIGVQDPYKNYASSSAKSYLTFDDCLFSNCKSVNGNTKGTGGAFNPSTYYSLNGIDASKVESVVSNSTNGAGATLTVEECKGVITSNNGGNTTPTEPSNPTETNTTATLTKTGSGSSNQEVEVGTAIAAFGYKWTEATGATVSGLPNGVTASVNTSDKTISISGTPTTAGTFKFTVATTGATTNATKSGTITVKEKSGSGSNEGGNTGGGNTGGSESGNTGSTTTPGSDVDNNTYSDTIYCSPNGNGDGKTISNPANVLKAIANVPAGGVIFLLEGTYKITSTINIEESNSGTANALKTIAAYKGAKVTFDFTGQATDPSNRGIVMQGSYWHFYGFEITKAGDNGMLLAGSHNLIEKMVFSKNQDTGLQISRFNSNYNNLSEWPSYNTILNCTAHNNCDDATMENADGFAAKLTCGEGNVFDGCMSYNNSDDGWDLFAKEATGPIGIVTLKNCIAFRNGYTEDGRGYGDCDGNGFKLGGSGIGSAHVVYNCLAFENLHCGFTDNNNPKLGSLTYCTAVNNNITSSGKPNFSLYRCTACDFKNMVSFYSDSNIKPANDKYVGTYENGVYYNSGYYQVDSKTNVTNGEKIGTKFSGPTTSDFLSTSVPAMNTADFHTVWRNADGSLNPKGYMETKAGDFCSMGYHMVNLDCAIEELPNNPTQTNVENIASEDGTVSGPIFDIFGRTVNSEMLRENKVYICNGKKFIFRR
ncbi:MAG: hypothetical protein MJZ02_00420 [Paludibacteraceae bacterium]|nr:hypothetical protein [Paludibacteraceae bacterium]